MLHLFTDSHFTRIADMEEQEFEFALERMYTMWERGTFFVKAASLDEAIEKAKQMVANDEASDAICDNFGFEPIHDTYELVDPSLVKGTATEELRAWRSDTVVWSNATNVKEV